MIDIQLIISLIVASMVYGNITLIVAGELLKAPFFITLFSVVMIWTAVYLLIFVLFMEQILGFFSRFKFFKSWLDKARNKANEFRHHHVILGIFIATIIPFPPFGLNCGSVVGLTLGLSKLKTMLIVWLTNLLQFFIFYVILIYFI